ncbi:uncharacterized protein CG45076 isoform X3 [Drosophila sulfurigaster albostrigata]|uniref:uncharacterized protein CG45076 isoform X2 n=1 Tax=Drosophila nasuta TaxID=42062 RepID=UPI00295E4E62|nr:uncharacterized protein CG45076 isoform X2 [Drosophila nasuta]XP_062122100.1 uncharacterized protein CG45076 isoform X3 [Drosophila sulfurigaster albostrigata]
MVYESGFTTRRTYTSRPVTTSYAVTYPSVQKVTRVYKTSYPIYSSYSIPTRRYVSGTRVISSPVRVVTSPTRVVSRVIHSPSPVRVVRTTTRVVSSPERTTSYSYSTPSTYYSPSTYLPSSYYTSSYVPTSYTTYTPSYHYNPTTITRVYARSASPLTPVRITTSPVRVTPSYLKRLPPGYGARALTNYLNTEPFTTFSEETGRIRNRAQSLIRDLHTPVVRRARSCTPFPVTGYTYEPTSQLALDAYVARVTNPVRHVAKEVHNISHYPRPAVKYVGKSHLASVRICGDKAYNIRSPKYDSDKVRTDINLLSWYLRHPTWKNENQKKVPHQEVEAVEVEA